MIRPMHMHLYIKHRTSRLLKGLNDWILLPTTQAIKMGYHRFSRTFRWTGNPRFKTVYPIRCTAKKGNILLQDKLTAEKPKIIVYYIFFTVKPRGTNDSSDSDMQAAPRLFSIGMILHIQSPLLGYLSHLNNPVECQMLRVANKITCGHLEETLLLYQLSMSSRPRAPQCIIL